MANHTDRIKAFKKGQYTRLKREEDEEQWISGEELCTEGSSDEESSTHKVRSAQKKFSHRAKIRSKTFVPSPLALKQGAQCETTAEYSDLPEIPTAKPFQDNVETKTEQRMLGDDLLEKDLPIQWRPKKGSIQLTSFSDGASLEHVIHENEKFFKEMSDAIKYLKSKPSNTIIKTEQKNLPKFLKDGVNSTLPPIFNENKKAVTSFEEQMEEPRIKKMFEKIVNNDKMIEQSTNDWISAKKERERAQSEKGSFYNDNYYVESTSILRVEVKDSSSNIVPESQTTFTSNTFLDLNPLEEKPEEDTLIQVDIESEKIPEENENGKPDVIKTKCDDKLHKTTCFIERNKELAKYGNMAICMLTDDEKEKLTSLLQEIDDEEEEEIQINEQCEKLATITEISLEQEEIDERKVDENFQGTEYVNASLENAFKLLSEEASNMESINARLELLKHSRCSDGDGKEQSIDNKRATTLEVADLNERKWKEQLLMNRLKSINKELGRIAREQDGDKERTEGIKLRNEPEAEIGQESDLIRRANFEEDLIVEDLDDESFSK